MKRKLKSWEQFESEFKPLVKKWISDKLGIDILYNNMYWVITTEMKKMFGTEIEVRKVNLPNYTYEKYGYYWHESWFESKDKVKEDLGSTKDKYKSLLKIIEKNIEKSIEKEEEKKLLEALLLVKKHIDLNAVQNCFVEVLKERNG